VGLDPAGIHEFRAMIRGFVAEGRTVLLSSHLLDEVERICDQVAIVDRGRVVIQGSIAELAADGEQTILIATSGEERMVAIIAEHRAVEAIAAEPDGIRVTLHPDVDAEAAAGDIARRLVLAGLVTAGLPRVNRPRSWSPRLVSAEFMKLRKRRGLVLTALLLTVAGSMTVLPLLSVVAAILVGATLGTGAPAPACSGISS
jgi:hypothetical protein